MRVHPHHVPVPHSTLYFSQKHSFSLPFETDLEKPYNLRHILPEYFSILKESSMPLHNAHSSPFYFQKENSQDNLSSEEVCPDFLYMSYQLAMQTLFPDI